MTLPEQISIHSLLFRGWLLIWLHLERVLGRVGSTTQLFSVIPNARCKAETWKAKKGGSAFGQYD